MAKTRVTLIGRKVRSCEMGIKAEDPYPLQERLRFNVGGLTMNHWDWRDDKEMRFIARWRRPLINEEHWLDYEEERKRDELFSGERQSFHLLVRLSLILKLLILD